MHLNTNAMFLVTVYTKKEIRMLKDAHIYQHIRGETRLTVWMPSLYLPAPLKHVIVSKKYEISVCEGL